MPGSHGNCDHPSNESVPRASDVAKAWLGSCREILHAPQRSALTLLHLVLRSQSDRHLVHALHCSRHASGFEWSEQHKQGAPVCCARNPCILSGNRVHFSLAPALALEEPFQSQAPDKRIRLRGTGALKKARSVAGLTPSNQYMHTEKGSLHCGAERKCEKQNPRVY